MFVVASRILAAAFSLAALTIVSASAQSPGVAGQAPPGSSDHLQEMERELGRIRQESQELGGEPTPGESIKTVRTRMYELDDMIGRMEQAAKDVGASAEDLEKLRQGVADTTVIGLSDVAQEAGEEVVERGVGYCLTRMCFTVAGKTLGWVTLVGDVVEYGGKYVIREINEDAVREMVRSETIKLGDVYELITALRCEQSAERAKARRLEQLGERSRFLFSEIAQERKRQRLSRNANLSRDRDPAGDAKEAELHKNNPPSPPRIDIRPADAPAPRRPTPGVRLAEPSRQAMNLSPFATDVLAAHNSERARVGAGPLQWDPALAQTATAYAAEMARTGKFTHASRDGRGIVRENINQAFHGSSPDQLMANWLNEKRNFVPGTFPNVSRTGNWYDVGHYSQMIWPETTHVGCGSARGARWDFFVCRYSPGGNKDGKPVGQPVTIASRDC